MKFNDRLRNALGDYLRVPRNSSEYCYIRPDDNEEFILYIHEGVYIWLKIVGDKVEGRVFDDWVDAVVNIVTEVGD